MHTESLFLQLVTWGGRQKNLLGKSVYLMWYSHTLSRVWQDWPSLDPKILYLGPQKKDCHCFIIYLCQRCADHQNVHSPNFFHQKLPLCYLQLCMYGMNEALAVVLRLALRSIPLCLRVNHSTIYSTAFDLTL